MRSHEGMHHVGEFIGVWGNESRRDLCRLGLVSIQRLGMVLRDEECGAQNSALSIVSCSSNTLTKLRRWDCGLVGTWSSGTSWQR